MIRPTNYERVIRLKAVLPPNAAMKCGNKMIRRLADHSCYIKKVPPPRWDPSVRFMVIILAQVTLEKLAA